MKTGVFVSRLVKGIRLFVPVHGGDEKIVGVERGARVLARQSSFGLALVDDAGVVDAVVLCAELYGQIEGVLETRTLVLSKLVGQCENEPDDGLLII